ncbi:unnamed protein product [Kuraishia capsulata CBS 1993]|uniref:non-specific serine/threonine protein kinase n=1 Tax=Kuraishia capsulata CBS 1993 TaxID=1382522 RepID=W6MTD7_9ASCO|nr:uncharacterized protein KUCA_T00000957001 [Kuraishia capsulata CBS 1993]CDK24990.1 unnamed protein product [Kuraishia capsulata CBS 1993]
MPSAPPPNAYAPGTILTVGSHQVKITKYLSQAWHNTTVACLKRVAVPDKRTLNLLRAEVDAMKRLQGRKYIVSYIDSHASRMSSEVGYEVFVLMEYCSRNGLIDFMNTRLVNKLKEPEILQIMAEITEGVAEMHALQPPLIHRDIKIENVLITGDGISKVCDFGSAAPPLRPPKNVEEFQILQDDIMKHTTPQYRSPEMIDLYRRQPIDEKSDIWALGVFLYKLCYYTTPFESNSINGNLQGGGGEMAILHARFQFPASPIYSSRLKNVISKCLQENPAHRPNVYQLLEEICKIRNVPITMKNFYLDRKVATKSEPSAALPQPTALPIPTLRTANEEYKPVIPHRSHVPTTSEGFALHRSKSAKAESHPGDPFSGLGRSKGMLSNKSQPEINRISMSGTTGSADLNNKIKDYISGMDNNGKVMTRYVSEDSITDDGFTRPHLPVQRVRSPAFESLDKFVKPTSRNSSNHMRPLSLSASEFRKLQPVHSSSNSASMKQIMTGITQEETVEFSPELDRYDRSRPLSRQSSGKSWKQQLTGESIKALRNVTGGGRHNKRSSISSIKDLFTGGKNRDGTRSNSSSRNPSSSLVKAPPKPKSRDSSRNISSDSLHELSDNAPEFSSSNEMLNRVVEEEAKPTVKRSSSIQRRVHMLLSRKQSPPPAKTAKGYGKFTDDGEEKPVERSVSTEMPPPLPRSRTVVRPQIKVSLEPRVPLRRSLVTPPPVEVERNVFDTPSSTMSSTLTVSSASPKKAPPPKPKKPSHLKSPTPNKLHQEFTSSTTTSSSRRSSGYGEELQVPMASASSNKRSSITSDFSVGEIDDLEKHFQERFPSAV